MKNKYIHICMSDELKKELQSEANKLNISLNAYIKIILSKRKEQ